VTPFPQGDRYHALLLGDSLGAGIAPALTAVLAKDNVEVAAKVSPGLGLGRNDGTTWDAVIDGSTKADNIQIAVILTGADDRSWIRSGNRRLDFASPNWRQEYEHRADALIKSLRARNISVYWLGLPIMRTDGATAAAQLVNSIYRERTQLNGAKYIDSWDTFADADGGYSDTGPDMSGIVKPLRDPDGVHMTFKGYEKYANLVERQVAQDLALARAERDVPLAGDVNEQQNVRDESLPGANGSAPTSAASMKNPKDYPEEDTTISIPGGGSGGSVEQIRIVRPSIPVAIVNQIRSIGVHASPGHTMPADLMGGLTALSSVATSLAAADGHKKGPSLIESSYYKLLVRGDSLLAKPGRVDDFGWPRPGQPPPE
jgi:hypothetical protein